MLDRIANVHNVHRAFYHVCERASNTGYGAGLDGINVAGFGKNLAANVDTITRNLLDMTYTPTAVKEVPIDDSDRILGVPTVRDRVAATAIRLIIEPVFEEKVFHDCSYGYRPGRGPAGALRAVMDYIQSGHDIIFESDVAKCFDSIQHGPLMSKFRKAITYAEVNELVLRFMRAPVDTKPGPTSKGLHQGAPLSPLLCNLYLTDFDNAMFGAEFRPVRYADDLIVCCASCGEAAEAQAQVRALMVAEGLQLKEKKTFVKHARAGFVFLGYDIRLMDWGIRIRASQKSIDKLYAKIDELLSDYELGQVEPAMEKLQRKLAGWAGHFAGVNVPYQMPAIDNEIRTMVRDRVTRKDWAILSKGAFSIPSIEELCARVSKKLDQSSILLDDDEQWG